MASGTATTSRGRIRSTERGRGPSSVATASVRRFIDADGTSHTRALAYQSVFAVLSGFIGLIGVASLLGVRGIQRAVQHMAATLSPGPSGKLLEAAAKHGASSGGTAALFGLLAALTATTLAMAQVERSANRLAGVDDRRGPYRFLVAFGLAVSAGILLAIAALILAGGDSIATGWGWRHTAASVWNVLRWPLGIGVALGAIYLLFRVAPRRTIRPNRAVWIGAVVAVVLWVVFTAGLALYLSVGGGQTYGSLIAIVALLLWAVLTSLAMHLGLSVAYELESRIDPGSVRLPDSDVVRTSGTRG
jgi:YihY family inner membrane protein